MNEARGGFLGPQPLGPRFLMSLRLTLRLTRRGLRAGARGLWGALLCLALGVAAIGGIGSLQASIAQGLASSGRQLLGGDLEVGTGGAEVPGALRAWFTARGARLSEVVTMHAMLIAPSGNKVLGGRRVLVSLLAVDRAWPPVGRPQFVPEMSAAVALKGDGLAASPIALNRLGLKPGQQVMLGEARFTIRAALDSLPGQMAAPSLLGPPALIAKDALPATGLVQPGSLVRHTLKVVLPPGTNIAATKKALSAAFPDSGWRVRDASNAAPGLSRFLERTALFMTLVALTSLLVGGIGVFGGVASWAEARLSTLAVLRALGASTGQLAAALMLQILILAMGGIVSGVIIGAALTPLIAGLFGTALPIAVPLGIHAAPLLLAAGFGLVTAVLCMLWPILRVSRVSGAALFRQPVVSARVPVSAPALVMTAILLSLLVLLAILGTGSPRFVLYYTAAAGLALVALAGAGHALMQVAAGLARRAPRPWLRLGLGDLHRPGAPTLLTIVSIGLGLATLAAVALIERNLDAELLQEMPKNAPSFYFIDIQNSELGRFRRLMKTSPGVLAWAEVPMLRARIIAANGVPAADLRIRREARWTLREDLGLTYADRPPPGTEITAGRWWPAGYRGPPLVSLDARLAADLGIRVGGMLTLNVLGRDLQFRVTNLRHIVWQRLGLNFFLVASPGLLAAAPHTNIATVRVAPGQEEAVLAAVTDALPNVSAITVKEVLAEVAHLFNQIAAALAALGGFALLAGILVLGSAMASEQRRRIRQAVILKTLGATRGQIRAAWLVSFAAEGAVAGVIAAAVAVGTSFGVVRYLMHGEWRLLAAPLAATVLGGVVLLVIAGYWGTGSALGAKAGPWLRNE